MPKQTVQEAAEKAFPYIWPKNGAGEEIIQRVGQRAPGIRKCEEKRNAFIAGSAWQKQQGIDWISVDQLPEGINKYDHGTESAKVLLTDGNHIGYSFYIWYNDNTPFGWHFLEFIPTHYALITLPKTDE